MSFAKNVTVVGVFDNHTDAKAAMDDLTKTGFTNDQIGVVARDARGKTVIKTQDGGETHAGEGAGVGAVAGAGVGALVGLGVVAGVIPVLGPAIAAGTLATIFTNAAGGAAVAGLAGALIGWGVPEEDAKYYDSQLHEGRTVVTVHAGARAEAAREIIKSHRGYREIATSPVRM